jgi:ribose 5-phosphate isomerase A
VTQDDLKRAAAEEALRSIRSGMTVGLGTGSTVRHFVDLLGAALVAGSLRDVVGVPTSVQTRVQALEVGIPLVGLGEREWLDVTVDGADEVSPGLDLIKGLGGALLREKMVAQASRRFLVITDDSKLVGRLGELCPLPVEVVDWALEAQIRFLERTGASVALRRTPDGAPVRSDNGNVFLDCRYPDGIPEPAELEGTLAYRAGVLDCGLFLGMADSVVVASSDGVRTLSRAEAEDRTGDGALQADGPATGHDLATRGGRG